MGNECDVVDPVCVGLGRGAKGGSRYWLRGGTRESSQVEIEVPSADNTVSATRVAAQAVLTRVK